MEELEEPLIALGLVENRAQVLKIVEAVDEDGSGEIEFNEFLDIIKGGGKKSRSKKEDESEFSKPKDAAESGAIYGFFKSLTNGELMSGEKANMPFNLFISAHRRQMIIDSMMKEGTQQKEGERIMTNYKK